MHCIKFGESASGVFHLMIFVSVRAFLIDVLLFFVPRRNFVALREYLSIERVDRHARVLLLLLLAEINRALQDLVKVYDLTKSALYVTALHPYCFISLKYN
jgi:hypothetical protein